MDLFPFVSLRLQLHVMLTREMRRGCIVLFIIFVRIIFFASPEYSFAQQYLFFCLICECLSRTYFSARIVVGFQYIMNAAYACMFCTASHSLARASSAERESKTQKTGHRSTRELKKKKPPTEPRNSRREQTNLRKNGERTNRERKTYCETIK